MALIVQKYGGTSVGSPERILAIAEKVKQRRAAGDDMVVVVSAMSGETDRLLKLAKSIDADPSPRELDVAVATGEQVTIALLAMALEKIGCPARSYTGSQVHILTDSAHGKARILRIDEKRIREDLKQGRVVVVAGFQGVDEAGNITTLGRGGSDTTGVALAAALKADECQIFPEGDGVSPTDRASCPRPVDLTRSRPRKCSKWRRSVPRCCRFDRSSLPKSTRCRCVYCRPSRKGRARLLLMRKTRWKRRVFQVSRSTATRPS